MKYILAIIISSFVLSLSAQQHSFYNKQRIGFFYTNSTENGGVSLSTTNGIYLTDQLSVGINLAIQSYTDAPTFYPVSVEAAYFFKNEEKTPYVYGNLGRSFVSAGDLIKSGGISSELGIGWIFKLWKIRVSPEFSIRNERFRVRTFEYVENKDGTYQYQTTGPYVGDNLFQYSFGLGIFF